MMTRDKSLSLVVLISLFCLPSQPAAQTVRSTLGGLPGVAMRMGFGARGIGMGNALTAVKSGDIVGYYNPGLTPFQSLPSGVAAFGLLPLNRRLNFISYTQELKPTAGISVGIINAGVSNIEGRDNDGVPTETYSTSENAFLFGFANKFGDSFSVGIGTKILYYSLFQSVTSTTVGFDIGLLYVLDGEWAIGAVLQDVNSKYKWDTSKIYGRLGNSSEEVFPLRKRIGVSYEPKSLNVLLSWELEFVGSEYITRVGGELRPIDEFTLRAGVDQINFGGSIVAKPSFGFALQTTLKSLRTGVHYAMVLEPYSPGEIHIISLSLTFE